MYQAKSYEIYIVDAFTSVRYAGNPAGVCYLTKPNELSETQMKSIAMEMNLSETAFFSAIDQHAGIYSLKWFTPTTEVKLCGV
jgi:PhzF family phenazine biosynthesis protein